MTASELHEKITRKGMLEKWGNILIERWVKSIDKVDAVHTRALAQSFKKQVSADKIRLEYLKYGSYVDMGAGSGYTKGQMKIRASVGLGNAVRKGRKPKKWKSKTMYSQIAKLAEIVAREDGRDVANYVASNIIIPLVIEQ
jgi:hypothetical protein